VSVPLADHYQRISAQDALRGELVVYRSTPAPPSSPLVCTLGLNAGILQLHGNEVLDWLTPRPAATKPDSLPRDIFTQDFSLANPSSTLLAGGRPGKVWTIDLRAAHTEWQSFRHGTSITHLRSITHHEVVVAGLQNTMCVYDTRWLATKKNKVPIPILEFPAYRNRVHIDIGWDVDLDTHTAAAAHDDGSVALYSLRTGRRLKSPHLDQVRTSAPLKCLIFQSMPRDRTPSLFLGVGSRIRKYTSGIVDEAAYC
jgi:hypothetical protein